MLLSLWPNYWDDWLLYHKVTFDGVNRWIIINQGVTELDVKNDVYSSWKEWVELRENGKYLYALSAVGGDPITGTAFVGTTYFLENGWRVKMWDGNFVLSVNGNLYTREPGQDPYIGSEGNYRVTVSTNRSNLVDLIIPSVALTSGDITSVANASAEKVWSKDPATMTANTIGDVAANKLLTKNQFISLKD